MSQENQELAAENNADQQEQMATDAVANADVTVAEQATGYAAYTPEEAEQVARSAVEAAVNATAEQTLGGEGQTPQMAEQQATEAVAATEY
ncbi:hypothetical protein CBF23_008905 [Marinomonas agarivorans]|nr:hypothetical protein CBF23_008905 [Marinomonas agarivorans]